MKKEKGGGGRGKERKVLGRNFQWREVTHHALPLIDQGKVWDVMKELPTDALLICCDDICTIPHSFPGNLYNSI